MSTAATNAVNATNPNARGSSAVSRIAVLSLPRRSAASDWLTTGAAIKPAAVPSTAISRLSTMSCWTRRLRVAPMARRVASSRSRVAERAISRLARFRQASSNMAPQRKNTVVSGLANVARR